MTNALILLAFAIEALMPMRVYSPEHFDFPIVSQGGCTFCVSSAPNTVTFFELPSYSGTTALIAHDYLAGREFTRLHMGDSIYLDYGGRVEEYVVTDLLFYRPSTDPRTPEEIYNLMYKTPGRLVLQTCWGDGYRFVVAYPGHSEEPHRWTKRRWQSVPQFKFNYVSVSPEGYDVSQFVQ